MCLTENSKKTHVDDSKGHWQKFTQKKRGSKKSSRVIHKAKKSKLHYFLIWIKKRVAFEASSSPPSLIECEIKWTRYYYDDYNGGENYNRYSSASAAAAAAAEVKEKKKKETFAVRWLHSLAYYCLMSVVCLLIVCYSTPLLLLLLFFSCCCLPN